MESESESERDRTRFSKLFHITPLISLFLFLPLDLLTTQQEILGEGLRSYCRIEVDSTLMCSSLFSFSFLVTRKHNSFIEKKQIIDYIRVILASLSTS